jgi:hypothetical protein
MVHTSALALLALAAHAAPAATPVAEGALPVFATAVVTPYQERAATYLIESIRAFGGALGDAPVYVTVADPDSLPCSKLKELGARVIPLDVDGTARSYPFAFKVYAAAQVERMVASNAETLIWFDAETLVLAPPRELVLDRFHAVATHPVFLLNTIGLPSDAPPDEYWSEIYRATGVDPAAVPTVESFVESVMIRFYANCGVIAYRPDRGICREWARAFNTMVSDEAFQRSACADPLHRIFLHQAVLSAVAVARTRPSERRALSSGYVYPLHLQERVPIPKRARALNGLTCVVVESLWQDRNDWAKVITVDEPLRSWITARQTQPPLRP